MDREAASVLARTSSGYPYAMESSVITPGGRATGP